MSTVLFTLKIFQRNSIHQSLKSKVLSISTVTTQRLLLVVIEDAAILVLT